MPPRYFSAERGLRQHYGIEQLRDQAQALTGYFASRGYLAQWFGIPCERNRNAAPFSFIPKTTRGWEYADARRDLNGALYVETLRSDLYPIKPVHDQWGEDQIFDFLQFLASIVSAPTKQTPYTHNYLRCLHPEAFNHEAGIAKFLPLVNSMLAGYGMGWQMLSEADGFAIVELPPTGLKELVDRPVADSVDEDSRKRVKEAIEKYRRRHATKADKRDAVLDLGGVLERHRQRAKDLLGKTESDLFNLLNNFDLRHNNELQKADYDPIWVDALFYYYLNIIHTLGDLLQAEAEHAAAGESA